MISTTQIQNQWADLTQNNSSTNMARGLLLYNQQMRYYATKYWFTEVSQSYPGGTVVGQTAYNEPYNMKDVIDFYITVGSLRYTLTEAPNAIFWDQLQFAQYSSDIPQYYFRFNGQTNIFPTPASNGNAMTWRYKKRLTNLSQADYTTGSVSIPYAQTLTARPTIGATSLSLTGAWALPTGAYRVTFSDNENILATMTNGSTVVSLQAEIEGTPNYPVAFTAAPIAGATSGTLTSVFALASGDYLMTLSDGEVITGTFTNSSASVTFATAIAGSPNSVVYLNSSSGGNVENISTAVTFRVAQGGDIIIGAGTSWHRNMAGSWIQITPNSTSETTSGDGNWYQIYSVDSTTQLTLVNQYQGPTVAVGLYTIGEMPIIPEDYQDIPLYAALKIYFASVVPDVNQFKLYDSLVEMQEIKLNDEFGSKSTDIRVLSQDASLTNPNLYTRSIG